MLVRSISMRRPASDRIICQFAATAPDAARIAPVAASHRLSTDTADGRLQFLLIFCAIKEFRQFRRKV
jgi:hypothetical protein